MPMVVELGETLAGTAIVAGGLGFVIDEDNADGKPVVPELYREDVAEYLATHEG